MQLYAHCIGPLDVGSQFITYQIALDFDGQFTSWNQPNLLVLLEVIELNGLPEKGDIVDWIQARLPDWDG